MVRKVDLLPGVLLFIILALSAAAEARNSHPCKFPAIFNFGDSNSDTGDYYSSPNGSTLVKIKRLASDGRLIMDFLTEKMGRPYLQSAYFWNDLSKGANFAAGGSTIIHSNKSSFLYLANQTAAFTQFKAETIHLQSQGKINSTLPMPEDFSKALYTIDIGQNDIAGLFCSPYVQEIQNLIRHFEAGLKTLYNEGARVFWIHNTGPHGCLPGLDYAREKCTTRDLDEFGCVKHDNQVASEFNKQLKDKVVQMRADLKGVVITYVDVYTAKYNLFKNAKNLGLLESCCVMCSDPSKYILWDNIHYTEVANGLVAESIFRGTLSDPVIPMTHACY